MASGDGAQYLKTGGEPPVKRWWGIYYGYVANNADTTKAGRVQLRVPQVFGSATSNWASPMVPVTYIPKVGTQVTVMFVGGDPSVPVWFGNFALPTPPAVIIGSGAPATSSTTPVGEIYYDQSDGLAMYEWNGVSWVQYQFGTAALASQIGITEPHITGGTITGGQFIGDGEGMELMLYAGTPAQGNLTVSSSTSPGGLGTMMTDPYGNNVPSGFTTYYSSGGNYYAMNFGDPSGEGTLGLGLYSSTTPGTLSLDSSLYLDKSNRGLPTVVMPSGLSGGMVIGMGDPTQYTVNSTGAGTTYNQCSKYWPIGIGDAAPGDVYLMEVFGIGETGNSAQDLWVRFNFGGITIAIQSYVSQDFNLTQIFSWSAKARMVVADGGSNGAFLFSMDFTIQENKELESMTANNTAAMNSSLAGTQSAVKLNVNFMAANSLRFEADWGSNVGSQPGFIESYGSVFQKISA